MKKAKYGLVFIILAFIALITYQNMSFLQEKYPFFIDMKALGLYRFPYISNGIYFLFFFLIGFLIAYFRLVRNHFKHKKTVKEMMTTIDSDRQVIAALEAEVRELKIRSGNKENTAVVENPVIIPPPPETAAP